VVRALLADLVDRGLTFDDGLLVVIAPGPWPPCTRCSAPKPSSHDARCIMPMWVVDPLRGNGFVTERSA
jgi:hypothetical protein